MPGQVGQDLEHLRLEVPPDPVLAHLEAVEVDLEGVIRRANNACGAAFGRTASNLVGRSLVSLFPAGPDGREKAQHLLPGLVADAEKIAFVRGDGSERWGQVFAWPVRDRDGAPRMIQIILQDITEQRRYTQERDLLAAQEQRRAAVESAIALFRPRVEAMLKTVGEQAMAMRSTANTLFAASSKASQRAEGAVDTSNEASMNVEIAAGAAEELAASIAEILAPQGRALMTAFVENDVPDWEENPTDYRKLPWKGRLHCVRFDRRFFEDLTQDQIASELDVSQAHVSRVLRRAIEKMRAELAT